MRAGDFDVLRTAVLVIGAGASGLRTAIELRLANVDSLVVGKRAHGDAHTRWAAGGINASFGTLDPHDRWELHAADTLREGHFVCDPLAVELLAREAPDRVRELADWGCPFDRAANGGINQRYFGAQSFRRTCFVGDETGEAILRTLVERAEMLGVAWMEDVYVTSLLVEGERVRGALALELESGDPVVLHAAATVLAAGGHTSVYRRSSSRPDENTGDSAALAYRAGARLRDMEFVQFHPTGWLHPPEMRGRLVTEAVRGEGGHLLNANGERFMARYSPERMELDARDVVARAIYQELREGHGTEHGGVLLDISHRDPSYIHERLPHVRSEFLEHGVDIAAAPMEVAPTAHYAMGGVRVDFRTGATDVPGLFAVGEATAGLHGANRLGGNSLAETVVFGRLTGAHLTALKPNPPADDVSTAALGSALAYLSEARSGEGDEDPGSLMEELRALLWDDAGIVRDEQRLLDGVRRVGALADRAARATISRDASLVELQSVLDLRSMVVAAEAIVRSALWRAESRGAHFRSDHPEEQEGWARSILCDRDPSGAMRLTTAGIPPVPRLIQDALDEHRELQYHHLE